MKERIFSILMLLSANLVFAEETSNLSRKVLHLANEPRKPFDYEDIVALIKEKKIRSVEALLPKLPKELRKNFTLMHNSQSLQLATPMHPRAILFTSNGKTICTFNGDRRLIGFDTLECSQFRDKERKFEFFEIVFPSKRNDLKEVLFSKPNMYVDGRRSCTACHGSDPRPLWDSYARWPGAYGGFDDSYENTTKNIGYDTDRLKPAIRKEIRNERDNFLAFKKGYRESPRYSQLIFPDDDEELSPYSDKIKSDNHEHKPNLRLTAAIANLMAKRNFRLLEKISKSDQQIYLALELQCEQWVNHLQVAKKRLEFLRKNFHVTEWLPHSRNLNKNCSECSTLGKREPDFFMYETGGGDLGSRIAFQMIKADPDLAPFATESAYIFENMAVAAEQNRNAICPKLMKKIGAAQSVLETSTKDR